MATHKREKTLLISELSECPTNAVIQINVPRDADRMTKKKNRIHFLHRHDKEGLPVHLQSPNGKNPQGFKGKQLVCRAQPEHITTRSGRRRVLLLTPVLDKDVVVNAVLSRVGEQEFAISRIAR